MLQVEKNKVFQASPYAETPQIGIEEKLEGFDGGWGRTVEFFDFELYQRKKIIRILSFVGVLNSRYQGDLIALIELIKNYFGSVSKPFFFLLFFKHTAVAKHTQMDGEDINAPQ